MIQYKHCTAVAPWALTCTGTWAMPGRLEVPHLAVLSGPGGCSTAHWTLHQTQHCPLPVQTCGLGSSGRSLLYPPGSGHHSESHCWTRMQTWQSIKEWVVGMALTFSCTKILMSFSFHCHICLGLLRLTERPDCCEKFSSYQFHPREFFFPSIIIYRWFWKKLFCLMENISQNANK